MKILVCMKQVPDTTIIKINPETHTLIRTGVPSIVNPFDGYALELGVRLKEAHGGTVTVISMGPDQAKKAIKECLAVGADRGLLISDRVFGGSDTLATSYILSSVIRMLADKEGPFDLILCGKQAIDGDTGQVGPEIAEHLDLPQVTCIQNASLKDGRLVAKRNSDEGYDLIECSLPAVATVSKADFEPRNPNLKSKMAASKAEIEVVTSADLTIDVERCGLKGSPTKVRKTFTPTHDKVCKIVQEGSGTVSACKLVGLLSDASLI